MTFDQSRLSKKLSPIIEEYTLADVVLIGSVLLVGASFLVPGVHPLMGVAVAWGVHTYLKARDFYSEDRSPLKNGVYTEIVEHSDKTTCYDCGNIYRKKDGYTVCYVLGYEIFRLTQFESKECEACELDEEAEMELN